MTHFLLILTLTFSGISTEDTRDAINAPSIEFSEPAAEFESGQPVFPKGTKAYLRNLPAKNSRVIINDQVDKVLDSKLVEVSKLIKLSEGTYTVMIESPDGRKETFGFTIK